MFPASAVSVVADVVSSLRIDTRPPEPFYMNTKSVNFGDTAADSGGRDVLTCERKGDRGHCGGRALQRDHTSELIPSGRHFAGWWSCLCKQQEKIDIHTSKI